MSTWGRVRAAFGLPARTFDEPAPVAFAEPYQPVNVLIEGLMHGLGRVGRDEALGVPAVLRGRNMICSISTLPLEAVDETNQVQARPLFAQLDPNVPNVVTVAQTLEDLLFEAVAWWKVTGFDPVDGMPSQVQRYAPGQVSMNPPIGYDRGYLPSGLPTEGVDGVGGRRRRGVWMAGVFVPWELVIRFDSPNPALLVAGQRAIRRAIACDMTAELYAKYPRRRGYFRPTEGVDPADDDAVKNMLNSWHRASQRHVDGYVPASMEYNSIQDSTPAELQLVQQQQRATLDLANALGIDPEDLGVSTTSRVYQNATDRRQDRINETLAPYMRAITDRLAMPDVTRPGVSVRFSLRDYLKADPKTRAEVQQIYAGIGATDGAEIRQDEGKVPREIVPVSRETAPADDTVPRETAVAAADAPAHTFSRETGLTFDGVTEGFAVQDEARTITALLVPWGQAARSGGRRWRFARGSIRWSAVNRVKLLRDHDNSTAMGRATRLWEDDRGLWGTFRVAPGRLGDEALALALDGVLDGVSVGVDFRDEHFRSDPDNASTNLVFQAALREVSLTAVPSFDDSRLVSVRAARNGDFSMNCPHCGVELTPGVAHTCATPSATPAAATPAPVAPAPAPVTFSSDQFGAFLERFGPAAPAPAATPVRPVVDPTANPVQVTREPLPYAVRRTFNRITGDEEFVFGATQEHNFSADLADMARSRDQYGRDTEAGRRVMGLLRATFADVQSDDINELNPTIQRPDMFVDQRDYRTPLMDLISRGAPPNGIQPFTFPKFSSATGLVADHVEGVEPNSGTYVATNQTVTPTAISGKASITREVWDMGGNPAVSGLIFNQMVRGYREGLETAAATFLNTLTAAADIALGVAATDAAIVAAVETALADLQFERGYDFSAFVLEKVLYKKLAGARATDGRPFYPILAPANANGTAAARFRTLDIAGLVGIPSWALASTPGAVNNSWIFDPSTVYGWWTAPQRLEFPGTDQTDGSYSPVAFVDLAIWGYKAFANSDIGGVRQVTYDSV